MFNHLKILFLFLLLANINTHASTITAHQNLDQSATNNTEVLIRLESDYSTIAFSNAVDFLETSGAYIDGAKVKVIMKIQSKKGVYIDDISDWGVNLVGERHPGALIQEEVLLEEGYYKMTGDPRPILEDGVPKYDPDGVTPWIEVELEELSTPLRNIN